MDWEAFVDVGRLRQIGNVAAGEAGQGDRARERRKGSGDALEQGRFAGAVRAANGQQRAALDLAVEMVHGRMPVIAKREIAEADRDVHGGGPIKHGHRHPLSCQCPKDDGP